MDFPTRPALCPDCEERLGRLETAFSRRVFHPLWTSDHSVVGVDDDVLRFAVSLAWRTLDADLADAVAAAPIALRVHHELWRRVLLGGGGNPGEHHMYMLRVVPYGAFDLGESEVDALNWYMFRSADAAIVASESVAEFAYVKLPGLAFLSRLGGPLPVRGTRLQPGLLLHRRSAAIDRSIRRFVFDRGIDAFRLVTQISVRQAQDIARRYEAARPAWDRGVGRQVLTAQCAHRVRRR